jgi:transcriptional regulator with XRE-family HTH domain
MDIKLAFGKAIKKARKKAGLSQESFSDVSSRTYVSTLERGLYTPTLEKIDELARTIGIHPMSLIALAYLELNPKITIEMLANQMQDEVSQHLN